jgi:hypothetical protein
MDWHFVGLIVVWSDVFRKFITIAFSKNVMLYTIFSHGYVV